MGSLAAIFLNVVLNFNLEANDDVKDQIYEAAPDEEKYAHSL